MVSLWQFFFGMLGAFLAGCILTFIVVMNTIARWREAERTSDEGGMGRWTVYECPTRDRPWW